MMPWCPGLLSVVFIVAHAQMAGAQDPGGAPKFYTFGDEPRDRMILDSNGKNIFIPDSTVAPSPGIVTEWKFYARRTGTLYLHIYRPKGVPRAMGKPGKRTRFQLIGQTKVRVTRLGINTYFPSQNLRIKTGDIIGIYSPGASIVPYDFADCPGRTIYRFSATRSARTVGTYLYNTSSNAQTRHECRMYSIKAFVKAPGKAGNSYTLGDEARSRDTLDSSSNGIFISESTAVPKFGKITKWKFYAALTGTLSLQIWRPKRVQRRSSLGIISWIVRFELVGQTTVQVSNQEINTAYPTEDITIQAGDVIGIYSPRYTIIPYDVVSCPAKTEYRFVASPDVLQPGAKIFSTRKGTQTWRECRKYAVEALVEMPASGVCRLRGDPHYMTFDGVKFGFQGKCTYTLAARCRNYAHDMKLRRFSVIGKNKATSTGQYAYTEYVEIKFAAMVIRLGQGRRFYLKIITSGADFKEYSFPLTTGFRTSLRMSGIEIKRNDKFITVETAFGLKVSFGGKREVRIRLGAKHMGKVCGLCGNFDGDRRVDRLEVEPEYKIPQYGKKWELPDENASPGCPKPVRKRDIRAQIADGEIRNTVNGNLARESVRAVPAA